MTIASLCNTVMYTSALPIAGCLLIFFSVSILDRHYIVDVAIYSDSRPKNNLKINLYGYI